MRGSGKVLIIIGIVTCMLLFYVHLNISSVIVSFELDKLSKDCAAKQELLKRLQFNVEQLKAPNSLEEKIKKHDLTLALPNRIQVMEVPYAPELPLPMAQNTKNESSYSSVFSRFLGQLIQTAQAKTDTLT